MDHAIAFDLSPKSDIVDDASKRAGLRVRNWRRARVPPISQAAFAKRAGVSVGCLQAFERGTRTTQEANITKIAKAMGVSVDRLYADSELDFSHPLLRDLRLDDFRIAAAYHHAIAELKFAVKGLLNERIGEELRARQANLLVSIQQSNVGLLTELEKFVEAWRIDEGGQRRE